MDFNTFVFAVFTAVTLGLGGIVIRLHGDLTDVKIQLARIVERLDNLMERRHEIN
jgi:hypothetical protein